MIHDVILVDVMKEIADAMIVPNYTINFQPGTTLQILQSISDSDNSITEKLKYPMLGMMMPVSESHGSGFVEVRIPSLFFAMSVRTDESALVLPRYETGGTFKDVLYPCYREFFKRLALSPRTSQGDPDAYNYVKTDMPGTQIKANGISDYVDLIEIRNLEIILLKSKTC